MNLRKIAASTLLFAATTFGFAATHASAQNVIARSTLAAADPFNPAPVPPPPNPAFADPFNPAPVPPPPNPAI